MRAPPPLPTPPCLRMGSRSSPNGRTHPGRAREREKVLGTILLRPQAAPGLSVLSFKRRASATGRIAGTGMSRCSVMGQPNRPRHQVRHRRTRAREKERTAHGRPVKHRGYRRLKRHASFTLWGLEKPVRHVSGSTLLWRRPRPSRGVVLEVGPLFPRCTGGGPRCPSCNHSVNAVLAVPEQG
jgi:hypothetical protein